MTTALLYTILPGDTMSKIADGLRASAGVTFQAIQAANPTVGDNLAVGMVLAIPTLSGAPSSFKYTVMPSDSYWQIAVGLGNCAGMTTAAIVQANPGVDPGALQVGQVIDIPNTLEGKDPVPTPEPGEPYDDAQVIGIWWWAYSDQIATSATPPAGANLGIAFNGWPTPAQALPRGALVKDKLPGAKYLSLGGGDKDTGSFTMDNLGLITSAINAGQFEGYTGLAYDVEVGDSGLADAFKTSFAAAKAKNLRVLVTVSHSSPVGFDDADALMRTFFQSPDIDILSPQLYSSGKETENDFATTWGKTTTWADYASAKAAVVPSIVRAGMYHSARDYLATQGVTITGFIQWSQN